MHTHRVALWAVNNTQQTHIHTVHSCSSCMNTTKKQKSTLWRVGLLFYRAASTAVARVLQPPHIHPNHHHVFNPPDVCPINLHEQSSCGWIHLKAQPPPDLMLVAAQVPHITPSHTQHASLSSWPRLAAVGGQSSPPSTCKHHDTNTNPQTKTNSTAVAVRKRGGIGG